MKKNILINVIFCLAFSSCIPKGKVTKNLKNDTYLNVQTTYRQEGKYTKKTKLADGMLVIEEYLNDTPYGTFTYIDSNNIPRKIEWYHKKDKPFATIYFKNIFSTSGSYFVENMDTNLIACPTIRCQKFKNLLQLEYTSQTYPVDLTDIKCFISDTILRAQKVVTNNSWYLEIKNTHTFCDFYVDFNFYDQEHKKVIKSIKRVLVEYPKEFADE